MKSNEMIKRIVSSAMDQANTKIKHNEIMELFNKVSTSDISAFKKFEKSLLEIRTKRERLQAKTRNRDTVE